MKAIIKKILGPQIIAKLRAWFPSAVQKKAEIKEIERKAAFYASFIPKGSICFDVGANVGNRIMPLLYIGAKVVAVEPQEKCYNYLKRKFGSKIILIRKGLGESDSQKEFHISNDSTISSFSDEWISSVKNTQRFKGKNWDKAVMIEMTTADHLIELYGKPSFIKIDVEGYELEVLKGLKQPVQMISFEYTVPEQPDRAIMCINQIENYNNAIECNYSIGEDLVWALSEWLSAEEMRKHIFTAAFQQTSFGDIYIRTKQTT
jgi:FkbM family methyltransferase